MGAHNDEGSFGRRWERCLSVVVHSAAVTERALRLGEFVLSSFDHNGRAPTLLPRGGAVVRPRPPVSRLAATRLGRLMLQDGVSSRPSLPATTNCPIRSSVLGVSANRPHMPGAWRRPLS